VTLLLPTLSQNSFSNIKTKEEEDECFFRASSSLNHILNTPFAVNSYFLRRGHFFAKSYNIENIKLTTKQN
jgi:hypothetical protein